MKRRLCIIRLASEQRSGPVCVFLIFALLLLSAFTVSAANTASFIARGSGDISIVEIRDASGSPVTALPDFDIFPSVAGPVPMEVEKTGSGVLAFAGSAGSAGSDVTTTVSIASDLSGSAVPVGVSNGIETVLGSIQFINNSGQAVEVTVRFDYGAFASATVTDAALETVSLVFYDIEFQESRGGDSNSPCIGGILVEADETPGFGAPPDAEKSVPAAFFERTMTIPNGSTCDYTALVQTSGRAEAIAPTAPAQPIPTLGLWATTLMAVLLMLLGIRKAGTRRNH